MNLLAISDFAFTDPISASFRRFLFACFLNKFLRVRHYRLTIIFFVIARAKTSLILVGLLLVLLPALAILQYRWIGEVSAAERDRVESSLRVASDQFALEFEAEFARLANAFQIRDAFPETAAPIVERFQA